ncbi:hypothetical protein [[Eubacterium] cellulosolvens]
MSPDNIFKFYFILLLSLILPNCTIIHIHASLEGNLTEDTYWTYQIITESESQGSGSYKGTSVSIKTIDGRVIIKEIDNERIVLEDFQKIIYLDYGSGFFKQNRTRESSQTLTYTIDRKSLTVISYYIKNFTGEELEKMKITGKPTTYFISNSLKRGQTTKYYWGGEIILCFVTEEYNHTETNPTMITLRYSGPKKVMIETVTRFPEDGSAKCKFNFDKATGILMSYEVNETALYRSSTCCAIEVNTTEKYIVNTVSFSKPEPEESDTIIDTIPEIGDNQYDKDDIQAETQITNKEKKSDTSSHIIVNYFLIILVIITSVAFIYTIIQRRRKASVRSNIFYLG